MVSLLHRATINNRGSVSLGFRDVDDVFQPQGLFGHSNGHDYFQLVVSFKPWFHVKIQLF